MDALTALVAEKRKILQDDATRPKKYMRRGDLERMKEEEEAKVREEKRLVEDGKKREEEAEKAAKKVSYFSLLVALGRSLSHTGEQATRATPIPSRDTESPNPESSFNISNEETIRRLRAKGQPIRLFGESDKDRRLRLRALELIEERDHERLGGHNDFKKALEDVESVEKELQSKNGKGKKKEGEVTNVGALDLNLLKSDPDKLYPIIYYALKRVLKEWEESMDERPEHIKRSTQGKLAAATQVQSAEYLKPLFKNLRSRVGLPSWTRFNPSDGSSSHFLPMCLAVLQRLCITCTNESTRRPMTPIFGFLSETHLGPSV
jgi:pre-mRNA-splicing factor 18